MLGAMRKYIAVIGAVGRSSRLRRIEGGFLLFSTGEWATWLAIVVYAFDRGGPGEAGMVGFAMSAPSILVAPIASMLGDRWPRARTLLASYALQAVAMVATAVALLWGPPLVAYGFAAIASTTVGLSRPALASLLPEVVTSPDELTAANVTSGIAEGAGALAGPLVAGALFAIAGAPVVFLAAAAGLAVAGVALVPIARLSEPLTLALGKDPDRPGLTAALGTLARELTAGGAAIAADRRLGGVLVVLAASIGLLGALGVFIVVIAIDLLGLDETGVGYLSAASGLGALVGSTLSVVLVGRERLDRPLIGAAIMFGLAVAVLGLVRVPAVVVLLLVATGVGWSFAYVAATTLTQRLTGDDVMTRVFGVTESVMAGAEALGGLMVPILIGLLGPTGALIAAGLALPLVAIVAAPAFLRADRSQEGFLRELRILRAVPMFALLSARVLERVASSAVLVTAEPGVAIITAGEQGDRWYVIVAGRAEVVVNGFVTRSLAPGDSFGEIALLHDVPRTATVRALESCELIAIEREPFLGALTGQPRSRALAAQIAERHLATRRG
jgi:MFS family permease